eukprot:5464421-Prymnesium_polylepis.1
MTCHSRRLRDSLAQGMAFPVPGKRPGGATDGSDLREMSFASTCAPACPQHEGRMLQRELASNDLSLTPGWRRGPHNSPVRARAPASTTNFYRSKECRERASLPSFAE